MDQTFWWNELHVWKPCLEGASWSNYRRYTWASRSYYLYHVWYPHCMLHFSMINSYNILLLGFRSDRQEYEWLQKTRSNIFMCFPSNWRRRVLERRRYSFLRKSPGHSHLHSIASVQPPNHSKHLYLQHYFSLWYNKKNS
jgi:hypothetical protein